jgi:hypothetical protein
VRIGDGKTGSGSCPFLSTGRLLPDLNVHALLLEILVQMEARCLLAVARSNLSCNIYTK